MNRHLNLFRTFSQNESQQHLEDNLSRGLVLCLKNDILFYHEFLKRILSEDDYSYLFGHYSEEKNLGLDIQVKSTTLGENEYRKIYALSLTSDKLDMKDFFDEFSFSAKKNYEPITDISIIIDDILILIEVKRHGEDCRQQLYNQVWQLFPDIEQKSNLPINKINIESLQWKEIMSLMYEVKNFESVMKSSNDFLIDFISLIQGYQPSWIPMQPLCNVSASETNNALRLLRLNTAIKSSTNANSSLESRLGFELNLHWVNELLFHFNTDDKGNPILIISMYPGNTKGQGWTLYQKSGKNLKWRNKSKITIGKTQYDLNNYCHLKFSSFQKYFTGLDFGSDKLKPNKSICDPHNFHFSGRKKRTDWNDLALFFDNHFVNTYDWREACQWESKVINTNKNQFDISFGYCCYASIPYKELQKIDTGLGQTQGLSKFVSDAYQAFLTI